jgi:lysophospholipase L1-like esterase
MTYKTLALIVVGWLSLTTAAHGQTRQPLALEKGDHVTIVGNTLAERMQHTGWLETYLHAHHPEKKLVVRNLAFSGDEIDQRIRSMNFGTTDEWLAAEANPIGGHKENRFEGTGTKADVIFAFYGYNESFEGKPGLDTFKENLGRWIKRRRAHKYNDESAPQLVLFSPIAHENLNDPNLPEGEANNRRLAMYTEAMADVAEANNVAFVDLFTPSRRLYRRSEKPLSINGIHLNDRGNWRVAKRIARRLFGSLPDISDDQLNTLRETVKDKNFYWFHRYRVVDGYSTYGRRAFLTFHASRRRQVGSTRGLSEAGILPTNYEVLQRELAVLDVMTANRDERIWHIAQGGDDYEVDDSNTPEFIDAKTNKPGQGPAGSHRFLSGEEAIDAMNIDDGFNVELFASEQQFPELANPVQMKFDTHGRLWVSVWPTYPHWRPKTEPRDKLLIYEDTDGDGQADKQTVFADGLMNPTGFAFYDGGVLVAQVPDVWFLKDTDGDNKADLRRRVLHGFGSADTHCAITGFTRSPGGGLYMLEGIFHRTQVETPWRSTVRVRDGAIYRLRPRRWELTVHASYPFSNNHGQVFDKWGRLIVMDATRGTPIYGPSISVKKYFPDKVKKKAPYIYNKRTRPPTSIELISTPHFPEKMQGNLLVQNVIGFRGMLNYNLSPDGGGLQGKEVDPLVKSSDKNFRPVDLEFAPDGSLYFADWHNPLIGHMQHNLRDNSRDHTHGRIYRVTHAERPLVDPPTIAGASIDTLLSLLTSEQKRIRYRAKLELGGRDTDKVLRAVDRWLEQLDNSEPGAPYARMQALWTYQWHNHVNTALLKQQLRSENPHARAAATRVLWAWRDRIDNPLALLEQQVSDPHPWVRLEAVRALSHFKPPKAAELTLRALKYEPGRYMKYTLDETMKTLDRFR